MSILRQQMLPLSDLNDRTHSLVIKVGKSPILIHEIPIHSCFVNLVQFSLEAIEICFSQRPCLGQCELLQLVSNLS